MENLDILSVINLYSIYKEILSILFYVPDTLSRARISNNMAIANYNQYVCMSSAEHKININHTHSKSFEFFSMKCTFVCFVGGS